jgi:hypothetical protein
MTHIFNFQRASAGKTSLSFAACRKGGSPAADGLFLAINYQPSTINHPDAQRQDTITQFFDYYPLLALSTLNPLSSDPCAIAIGRRRIPYVTPIFSR